MTESLLDALRPIADTIHDEGSRLARSLRGSSASEGNVREHLQRCLDACRRADAILNPPVEQEPVSATSEEVPARRRGRNQRGGE